MSQTTLAAAAAFLALTFAASAERLATFDPNGDNRLLSTSEFGAVVRSNGHDYLCDLDYGDTFVAYGDCRPTVFGDADPAMVPPYDPTQDAQVLSTHRYAVVSSDGEAFACEAEANETALIISQCLPFVTAYQLGGPPALELEGLNLSLVFEAFEAHGIPGSRLMAQLGVMTDEAIDGAIVDAIAGDGCTLALAGNKTDSEILVALVGAHLGLEGLTPDDQPLGRALDRRIWPRATPLLRSGKLVVDEQDGGAAIVSVPGCGEAATPAPE